MTGTYARGKDSSQALTEVRTVLSRAETALVLLEGERACDGNPRPAWAWMPEGGDDTIFRADPDIDDMIGALQELVRRLDRYRRTGRTPK